jgi:hypothetical protein
LPHALIVGRGAARTETSSGPSHSDRTRRGRIGRIAHRLIYVPETTFEIDRAETDLLVAELRLTARPEAAYDAAAAAERVQQASPPEGHSFPDGEAHALLRALDNLHWRSHLTNRSRMQRLREALMGTFGTTPIPYDLRFTDATTEGRGWFSSSGPYEAGDRLSTPYGDWRVVGVEEREGDHDVLVCTPFVAEDAVQGVEFSMPPHVPPVSINARDTRRLIDAIRELEARAPVALRIEAAMRLGGSTTIALSIGEDEIVLAALDRLEQTGDFLSPLRRLQRDLRAKIDAES